MGTHATEGLNMVDPNRELTVTFKITVAANGIVQESDLQRGDYLRSELEDLILGLETEIGAIRALIDGKSYVPQD